MKGSLCDVKTEVKIRICFTIILMMLSGIVSFLMALHINLELVVLYMSSIMDYIFAHISDQNIKEFIIAANQMDPVVRTLLWLLQVCTVYTYVAILLGRYVVTYVRS